MTAGLRLAKALADRYRVERELGAGGMATVYLAHDLRHDRDVAMKVLHPDLGAALGGERFLSEIHTTARLQHPHILPLLDSGEADGLLYYVMPLVTGETLRTRLERERQLPVDVAVLIAREAADALGYAHGLGVIHRDIKPENILLQGGHALVADFGIALAVQQAGGQRMTQTGLSLGTPQYMSPEQAMGERAIDARSDIYALGAVTYEMLVGEPPFTGRSVQAIVARLVTEQPRAISVQRRSVPESVEVAVLRALEKLPADRFATAGEFAAALKETSASRRPPASVRAPAWAWRRAVPYVAGAVIGAAAMAMATARGRVAAPASSASDLTQLTFHGRTGRPAISPNGDFVAYVDVQCDRGTPSSCRQSLLVQEAGEGVPVMIVQNARELSAPRWTHDGGGVVVSARLDAQREGLFLIPRLGGVARPLGPAGLFDTHASADSVLLVPEQPPGTSPVALVIATASGAIADSTVLPAHLYDGVAWSPDGRLLAVSSTDLGLFILGRDGTLRDSIRLFIRSTVRWSPSGDAILTFQPGPVKEDDLVRLAIDGEGRFGAVSTVMSNMQTLYRGEFDIARRSGHIVLASGNAVSDLWTFEFTRVTERPQQRTRGTSWYGEPFISPDGLRLFYLRGDAAGDNLYTLSLTDGREEALSADRMTGIGSGVRVSASGRRVSFGNGEATGGRRLSFMELATRRTTFVSSPYQARGGPLGERGAVDLMAGNVGLAVLDSIGGSWREIPAPDSSTILSFAVGTDTASAAVLLTGRSSNVLGLLSFGGRPFREIQRFDGSSFEGAVSWTVDDQLYVARWLPSDDAPSLWRWPAAGGAGTRVADLPAICAGESVVIAAAADRGACVAEDNRSDVWIGRVPGVTR